METEANSVEGSAKTSKTSEAMWMLIPLLLLAAAIYFLFKMTQ